MKINSAKKWTILLASVMVLVVALSACQPAGTPTPSAEEIAQRVAYTQQANATQQVISTLVAKVDELSNQPTWTPLPTYTPYPTPTTPVATAAVGTGTPTTPASAPTEQAGQKCYQMEFWGDVNYPPDSVVKPGKVFDKTWKVKNIGTCKWTAEFDIVFIGGDKELSVNGDITKEIKPGDVVEVTVKNIKAPSTTGTYWGYWMIQEPEGARFGYGNGGEYSLAIKIQVAK
ncbi:MAG: NBR1-Ig-like domain-containing protein [Anaerolineaceae bacterium]